MTTATVTAAHDIRMDVGRFVVPIEPTGKPEVKQEIPWQQVQGGWDAVDPTGRYKVTIRRRRGNERKRSWCLLLHTAGSPDWGGVGWCASKEGAFRAAKRNYTELFEQ